MLKKWKNTLLLCMVSGAALPVMACEEGLDELTNNYKLMQLTSAEQRVVLINSDNKKPVLLSQGDALLGQWALYQVLNDRAVFNCVGSDTKKIIIYKNSPKESRPPDVIDIQYTDTNSYGE